jgi:uncharacterized protein
MEAIGYMAIIAVGVVLGLMGAGGSILAIPILVYIFSVDMENASCLSLFLVGVSSAVGVVMKHRQQTISMKTVLSFGVPSFVGTFFSRHWILTWIPPLLCQHRPLTLTKNGLLLGVFLMLVFTSSISMILKKIPGTRNRAADHRFLAPIGLLTGLVVGLAGAGGGFLIVPSLIFFGGMTYTSATTTSLVIISVHALIGFSGDVMHRTIDWAFLFSLSTMCVSGMMLGHWAQKVLNARLSQQSFGWFTLLTGILMLGREILSRL